MATDFTVGAARWRIGAGLHDSGAHGRRSGQRRGPARVGGRLAVASPDLLQRVAGDAAPRIVALLTSIRLSHDKADPNSLLNRPARVMLVPVTGAPGDGNQSLTKQMHERLTAYGVLVQTDKAGADFLVRGDVVVTPIPNRKERVEIVWAVALPNGDERGKVVQLNEIPAGILSQLWGDVAVAVATEAAGGLNDVIARQSGRLDAAAQTATPH